MALPEVTSAKILNSDVMILNCKGRAMRLTKMPDSKQATVNDILTRQSSLNRWENEGGTPAPESGRAIMTTLMITNTISNGKP